MIGSATKPVLVIAAAIPWIVLLARSCRPPVRTARKTSAKQMRIRRRRAGTPFQEIALRRLRDRDDQQRRHRDVVGEMHQRVGERAAEIARRSGEPSGDDDREYGKNEAGHLHPASPAEQVSHSSLAMPARHGSTGSGRPEKGGPAPLNSPAVLLTDHAAPSCETFCRMLVQSIRQAAARPLGNTGTRPVQSRSW